MRSKGGQRMSSSKDRGPKFRFSRPCSLLLPPFSVAGQGLSSRSAVCDVSSLSPHVTCTALFFLLSLGALAALLFFWWEHSAVLLRHSVLQHFPLDRHCFFVLSRWGAFSPQVAVKGPVFFFPSEQASRMCGWTSPFLFFFSLSLCASCQG